MSTEAIVMTIITTVFTILVGVISFFLKSWMTKLNQLVEDIQAIKISLEKYSGRFELIQNSCTWKHNAIEKKFEDLEKRLIKSETDIDKLKTDQ